MKAFVLRAGKGRFEDRPVPRAGATDVVVRTTAVSVCSAELACISGEFPTPDGLVLGHEGVGVVHEVGSLVSGFEPGQRVTTASTTPCGACFNCQRGFAGHCGQKVWGGYSFGVTRDGTLGEYFVVPHANFNLVAIPAGVDDAAALCVPDTIATGSSAIESSRLPLGGAVVVLGLGHVGLGAVAAARARGAGTVISVKARPGGAEIAAAMGADHALNLTDHDVPGEVRRLTAGEGADLVVEATGVPTSFPLAVSLTRLGGEIAVLSSYAGDAGAALDIPLEDWGWGIGDKTILSVFQRCGSERMSRLLRLVESGRIDPAPLMTRRYAFESLQDALDDLAARIPGHVKPFIWMDGPALDSGQ